MNTIILLIGAFLAAASALNCYRNIGGDCPQMHVWMATAFVLLFAALASI